PKTIATTLNTAQSDLIKHQTRLEALKKLKKEVFYGGKKLSEWTQKERKITIDQRKKEEIALIDQPLDSSYAALKAENKWKEEHAKKYDKKKPKPSKTDSAKAREKKAEKRQTESREKYRDNDFISRLKFQATEELLNQLEDGKKPFTVFSGKETIDKLPTIVNEKIKTHIKSQEKLVLSKKQKVDKAELILNGIINELKEKTFKQYAKDQYEDWIKKRDKLLTISGFLFASGVTLHVASSWFKSKRKQLARDLILIQKAKVSEKEKQQMLKERQKAYAKYLPNWMKRFFYGYDLKDEINVLETREEASARDYS
ncbi:hypothetical protein KAU11_01045, partial [Candidatus Babeliales bacterium]|nr:hypothetical protein [Candidatus Babeliales bacterium]